MAETDLWFGTLSATVRVEDLPASRRVVAIELPANGEWRVCGTGASNADGIAVLPISGLPTSRIYAVAIDEWGWPFVPNMAVNYGDVIRPTQFVGWMYQVTQPGVLPVTEPDWWNSMAGIPQPVGTAMMQAIRHYQPIAHGPVSDIEWVEQEFDPYLDDVVALLHFDGDFTDETGRVWTRSGAAPSYVPSISEQLGSAIDFSGGTYLTTIGHEEIRDWNMDWTIEFFFRPYGFPVNTNLAPFGSWKTSGNSRSLGFVYRHTPNSFHLRWSTTGQSTTGNPDYELHLGGKEALMDTWSHIAFCRKGDTVYGFVDGKLKDTKPMLFVYISDEPFTVGAANSSGTEPSVMLLDELRITKGIARYTENFTPPSAPFPNIGPPL